MIHSRRTVFRLALAIALFASPGAWSQDEGASTPALATAAATAPSCEAALHGQTWARTELYFGLSRADGPDITDEEFQAFLDREVTPRFPDGLTLLTGDGQFRGASGIVVRERSKLLILFYPWNQARSRAANRIRALYKREFHQEAVLRADAMSCVSF